MGLVAKALGTILPFERRKVGFWKIVRASGMVVLLHTLFGGRIGEFWNVSGCEADWCSWPPNGLITPGETVYSKGARRLHRCSFFLNCISGWSLSWYEGNVPHSPLARGRKRRGSVLFITLNKCNNNVINNKCNNNKCNNVICCIWQMTEIGSKGGMALGEISSGLWSWWAKRITGLTQAVKMSDATCHANWPWNLT